MKLAIDPNPSTLTAGFGVLLLVGSVTWWVLSDEPIWPYENPTFQGKPVQHLIASLPAIGDFASEFNVNDENPFLPFKERKQQSAVIKYKRTAKPTKTSTPPSQVSDVPI